MASKNPPLSEQQVDRICDLANQGFLPGEIGQELGIDGRRVSAYYNNLQKEGRIGALMREKARPASGAAGGTPQTPVGELIDGVEKLKKLSEDKSQPSTPPTDPGKVFEKGIEAAEKAQERAEDRAGKSTPDQAGLYPLLETLVTQQNASHDQAMERMDTSHKLTLERIKTESEARLKTIDKESEARMKELEIKYDKEAKENELKRTEEKAREHEYWDRLEAQRAEERKSLEKLRTEEGKMVQEKLTALTSNVNEQLKHANAIIREREDSSRKAIEMEQRFSNEIVELKKSIGGDDQLEKIAGMAMDKIGTPILNVIEKRTGGNNQPHTKDAQPSSKEGDNGMGLLGDVGKQIAVGFKDGFLREAAPKIREFGDQFSEWIVKDMPVTMVLKQLFAWSEDPSYGKYVQAAMSYIAMNSLDETLKQVTEFLSEKAVGVFTSEKARAWYQRLQETILASFRKEDVRMQEFVAKQE